MSLISDALKRQEQLRAAHGTGAAQHEVATAAPPEVAVARPPEVAVARPPEVAAARPPEASRVSAQPRRVSGATSRGVAAPNLAPAGGATSPRQRRNLAAPAANPFAERERAAARRPNYSVLLMPVIGLLMLLVLLFLRREFIPRERTEKDLPRTPRKVEEPTPAPSSHDDPSREEGRGNREEGTDGPSDGGRDEARPSPIVDEKVELSNIAPVQDQRAADEPSALQRNEHPQPTDQLTDKPATLLAETQPQPTTWPAFTLTGIAVGRERLAILNTGEMLLAGETAKCGVKVEKVNAATVIFTWGGETKTLRKGEHSDKPAD